MRGPDLPADDLYARLELPPTAAAEAIEIAWRALLKRHHPDVAGEASLEAAKRINVAHDWLSDPILKARYDRSRARIAPIGRPGPDRPKASDRRSRWTGRASSGSVDRGPASDADDRRPPDLGVDSAVVQAFLDRVARLSPDELDRLALADPPPTGFVASIGRFLGADRAEALHVLELSVAERLPRSARTRPRVRDAIESFGQHLLIAGFLDDELSPSFRDRVEERMTRGWLAAVGQARYGAPTATVTRIVQRAESLTAPEGARLAVSADRLRILKRPWPAGTDPEEDEVLRVSAALAARDAEAAAGRAGLSGRSRAAVAAFAHVASLESAFGRSEAARLLRPWRDLDAAGVGAARTSDSAGFRRVET